MRQSSSVCDGVKDVLTQVDEANDDGVLIQSMVSSRS